MSEYYLKRIISSSDIAFRLAWKFRAPPAAGPPPSDPRLPARRTAAIAGAPGPSDP
jgi:hypothetical protein